MEIQASVLIGFSCLGSFRQDSVSQAMVSGPSRPSAMQHTVTEPPRLPKPLPQGLWGRDGLSTTPTASQERGRARGHQRASGGGSQKDPKYGKDLGATLETGNKGPLFPSISKSQFPPSIHGNNNHFLAGGLGGFL